jgi:hypothetical protein
MSSVDAWMLGRVVAAIAAGSAVGCGARVIGSEDAGSNAEASSGSSTTTTSTATTTTTTTSTSGDDSGTTDAVKYDVGSLKFDIEPLPDLGEDCTSAPNPEYPECDVELYEGQWLAYACIPEDDEACDGWNVVGAVNQCLGNPCFDGAVSVACGPDPTVQGQCCYWVVMTEGQICPGRPFVVHGRARLGRVVEMAQWADVYALDLRGLDDVTRAALADAWAEDGLFEHASVASFARFVLQLLAVGAPPEHVAAAQRAMAEELSHARVCFGLASAYAERPLGPDRLDVTGGLDDDDPIAMAVSVAREGCIAETISALQIQVAAQRATEPTVRTRLEEIAEQELRHAELAWMHLRWVLERATPRLREAVAQAFADATAAVPRGPVIDPDADPRMLAAHGQLPVGDRVAIARDALERIVAPAAAELLEPWTLTATRGRARA